MMIVIAHGCGCDSEREHARARTIEAEQRLYSTLEIFVRGIRCFLCSKCIPTMLARGCGGNREGKTGVSVSVFLCVYSVVGQSIVLGGGATRQIPASVLAADSKESRSTVSVLVIVWRFGGEGLHTKKQIKKTKRTTQCSSLCGDPVVRVSLSTSRVGLRRRHAQRVVLASPSDCW